MSKLNGGILLGTPNQAEQQFAQMRFAASIQVLAQLAAIDYAQAIGGAGQDADPLGTAEGGPQVTWDPVTSRCHAKEIAQLATAYAEWLLVAQGFLRLDPAAEPGAERTEFEKAAN